jgi:hypothetical protein
MTIGRHIAEPQFIILAFAQGGMTGPASCWPT